MSEARAKTISISWDDGLKHEFTPQADGTWDLKLWGTVPPQQITGFKREDMDRVLGTALKHTVTE